MSPADELRAAAKKLRQAADGLSGGWRAHDTWLDHGGHTATVLEGEGNATDLVAWLPSMSHKALDDARQVWQKSRWMALVDPDLAEPLAAWLESVADEAEAHEARGWGNDQTEIATSRILAVADAINGGTS